MESMQEYIRSRNDYTDSHIVKPYTNNIVLNPILILYVKNRRLGMITYLLLNTWFH